MQYSVRLEPAPRPPMPEDVRTARQLWWAVVAFGIVQLAASMVVAMGRRREFAEQMLDQMRTADPNTTATLASVDLLVLVAFGFVVIFGVVTTALGLLFIHFFGRGKLWARTLLTIVGVWLVLMAAGTLFALDAVTGISSLVAGGAAIVQGVLAGGAVYLGHRPDSTAYFLMNRR
ncbi:hypothetical protein [Nocardia arizonensis]|uniref:hypothetical protein n=1 Tax=Nocardia arizonensis TaxID=1141647 RepID=UPI0006D0A011|nr:hypothetical protein [Nocardia arizonensis]